MNPPTPPLTVRAALTAAQAQGLPRLEAQWLLAAVLGCSRTWLVVHDDVLLAPAQQQRWQDWLPRRLSGEPLAYLTGEREFHSLPLQVSAAVLDPRPDTETLVDWALDWLSARPPGTRVVDLGTGSGAIALALKHRRPDLDVHAVDLSPAALAVARANGARLGLPVQWHEGSWFTPLASLNPTPHFDLIVSNPPYIAEGDPHLPALQHEPLLALTSGAEGLDAIRHLVAQAPQHLRPGGALLLEHGHDQAQAVAALMRASGAHAVEHRQDLAGHIRCTGAHWS